MKKPNIQNILVPIDFSAMSTLAVETAKALARRFGARVHLLHVQDAMYPSGFMAPTPMLTGELIAIHCENKKRLRKGLCGLAAQLDLSPDDCHVLSTPPVFEAICEMVRKLSIDLIVMPTHGRTGLRHLFLGSTAERVVQHSPCPVLIAQKRTDSVNKILVPVDFSGCSLEALNYAINFAKKVAARIIVIHAVPLGYAYPSDGYAMYDLSEITKTLHKDAEQQMREFIRAAKFGSVKVDTAIRVGETVEQICAFAKGEDVDLIVTPTHGWTGFKHVLIGSTAEHVVRHAPCSVVVVPSHPRIRAAKLTLATERVRKTKSQIARKTAPRVAVEKENYIGNSRTLFAHPFPERRKTNKFRETHAHNGR